MAAVRRLVCVSPFASPQDAGQAAQDSAGVAMVGLFSLHAVGRRPFDRIVANTVAAPGMAVFWRNRAGKAVRTGLAGMARGTWRGCRGKAVVRRCGAEPGA